MNDIRRREFLAHLARIGVSISGIGSLISRSLGGYSPILNTLSYSKLKYLKPQSKIFIVGSGITGLCAGALLSKQGYKVHVLEAHPDLIGGHARTVEIQGLQFALGPCYVWNFGEGQICNKILKHLGLDQKIPFDPMNEEPLEVFFWGDQEKVNIPMGLDRFRDAIIARLPKERAKVKRFFSYIKNLFEGAKIMQDNGLYLGNDNINLKMALARSLVTKPKVLLQLNQFKRSSLADLFTRCRLSPLARRLLYGHGGIFAENEANVSVGVYAAATGYYHSGATYPRYGFQCLVDELSKFVKISGGKVETGKKVNKLILTNKRVVEILCEDGSRYGSDLVISNLSPRLTCKLVGAKYCRDVKYDPSNSLICCFIVVSADYAEIAELTGKNYWWQNGHSEVNFEDPDMIEKPAMLYVHSPSSNDIGYTNTSAGLQSLVVYAPGNFKQAKSFFEKGPEQYQLLKEKIAEQMLQALERQLFPELSGHVRTLTIYTPWDTYQELGAEQGNVYGRKPDVSNILRDIRSIKGIKNLHIACASVGLPGIATCFQTANILVEKLTGDKII